MNLEFGGQTSANSVFCDKPFEIGHVEANGAAYLYIGDPSLPNPAVQGGRRDREKLSRLTYVYELGCPIGRKLSFHGCASFAEYLLARLRSCVSFVNSLLPWRATFLARAV